MGDTRGVRDPMGEVLLGNCLIIFLAENEPHEGKRKAEGVWPVSS